MLWSLLPGDLIVFIGQYLPYRQRYTWINVCKRFQCFRERIMKPSEALIEQVYNGHYNDYRIILADASNLLICQHIPTISHFFEVSIHKYSIESTVWGFYGWLQSRLDMIMRSPSLREYFIHKSPLVYRRCLIHENTNRTSERLAKELPVYLEIVDWRSVLNNWLYSRVRIQPYRKSIYDLEWNCRNMSMMNYLYLQTHTNPNVDLVVSRIIKQHYRPTNCQVYKAVRLYILGDYAGTYRDDWETLLRLLLKEFPLSEQYQQRAKRLFHGHYHRKHLRPNRPLPKSEVFLFCS